MSRFKHPKIPPNCPHFFLNGAKCDSEARWHFRFRDVDGLYVYSKAAVEKFAVGDLERITIAAVAEIYWLKEADRLSATLDGKVGTFLNGTPECKAIRASMRATARARAWRKWGGS